MSMSISSAGYSTAALQNRYACNQRQQPPDPETALQQTFIALDTNNKGYLEKTDLDSALSAAGGSSDSSELFTALDSDEDGKITEEEMTNALKNMFSGNDRGQFAMRMAGSPQGMGGMAPPPPPPEEGEDAGFSVDELTQMASDLKETDSQRAADFETLAASFNEADADGNGKLTRDEAMGFLFGDDNASDSSAEAASATTSTTTASGDDSASLMRQIMALVKTYGSVADTSSTTESLLSLNA